jgi:hypothetical protein
MELVSYTKKTGKIVFKIEFGTYEVDIAEAREAFPPGVIDELMRLEFGTPEGAIDEPILILEGEGEGLGDATPAASAFGGSTTIVESTDEEDELLAPLATDSEAADASLVSGVGVLLSGESAGGLPLTPTVVGTPTGVLR